MAFSIWSLAVFSILWLADAQGPCWNVTFSITLGTNPAVVGWLVSDPGGSNVAVLVRSGTYASAPPGSVQSQVACLPAGMYLFMALAQHGQGWYGGTFQVTQGNNTLLSNATVLNGTAMGEPFVVGTTCSKVTLKVTTGSAPAQMYWQVTDPMGDNQYLYNGNGMYALQASGYVDTRVVCLVPGTYVFSAFTSDGLGWRGGTFQVSQGLKPLLPTTTLLNGNILSEAFVVGAVPCLPVTFNISVGSSPAVVSWQVADPTGDLQYLYVDAGMYAPQGYASQPSGYMDSRVVCLEPATYVFIAVASNGAGWPSGSFQVSQGSTILLNTTSFPSGSQMNATFVVGSCSNVVFSVTVGTAPAVVGWYATDPALSNMPVRVSRGAYALDPPGFVEIKVACLAPGIYEFLAMARGQGWYGGTFQVTQGQNVLLPATPFLNGTQMSEPFVVGAPCSQVTFQITVGSAPAQMYWQVTDPMGDNAYLYNGNGMYATQSPGFVDTRVVCLPQGTYVFVAFASDGAGWRSGTFQVSQDSNISLPSSTLPYGSMLSEAFVVGDVPCTEVTFQVNVGSSPAGVAWQVGDTVGDQYLFVDSRMYAMEPAGYVDTRTLCLEPGTYVFFALAPQGAGWPNGQFQVTQGTNVLLPSTTLVNGFGLGEPFLVGNASCLEVTFQITVGSTPGVVSWMVTNAFSNETYVDIREGLYASQPPSFVDNRVVCLEEGTYVFVALASNEAGWPSGTFQVLQGTNVLIPTTPFVNGPQVNSTFVVGACWNAMVSITLGSNPAVVGWVVSDPSGSNTAAYVPTGTYASEAPGSVQTQMLCLSPGVYEFMALARHGQGWYNGTFKVTQGPNILLPVTKVVNGSYMGEPFVLGVPCSQVTFTVTVGSAPAQMFWQVTDPMQDNQYIYNGNGMYATQSPGYVDTRTVCLPPGTYVFVAFASDGAGWRGGTFQVSQGANVLLPSTTLLTGNTLSEAFVIGAPCWEVTFQVNVGSNPAGVSWQVVDPTGGQYVYIDSGVYASEPSGYVDTRTVCLEPGTYMFYALAPQGAGWPNGLFQVTQGTNILLPSTPLVNGPAVGEAFVVGGVQCSEVTFQITVGSSPGVMSWQVTNTDSNETFMDIREGTYTSQPSGYLDSRTVCLELGTYVFIATASSGTGWPNGAFKVLQGTAVLLGPTSFPSGSQTNGTFVVGGASCSGSNCQVSMPTITVQLESLVGTATSIVFGMDTTFPTAQIVSTISLVSSFTLAFTQGLAFTNVNLGVQCTTLSLGASSVITAANVIVTTLMVSVSAILNAVVSITSGSVTLGAGSSSGTLTFVSSALVSGSQFTGKGQLKCGGRGRRVVLRFVLIVVTISVVLTSSSSATQARRTDLSTVTPLQQCGTVNLGTLTLASGTAAIVDLSCTATQSGYTAYSNYIGTLSATGGLLYLTGVSSSSKPTFISTWSNAAATPIEIDNVTTTGAFCVNVLVYGGGSCTASWNVVTYDSCQSGYTCTLTGGTYSGDSTKCAATFCQNSSGDNPGLFGLIALIAILPLGALVAFFVLRRRRQRAAAWAEAAQAPPVHGALFYPQPFPGADTYPAFPQPAFPQPAFPQPAFPQPAFPQPAFPQPAFPQPAFPQPAFPQPAFPPAIYQPAIDPQGAGYPMQGSYPFQQYHADFTVPTSTPVAFGF